MKTSQFLAASAGITLLAATSAQAALLAGQSFEAEDTPGGIYSGSTSTNHSLSDAGTANVVSLGIGGELGFSAGFTSTRTTSDGFDSDPLGVATAAQISGSDIGPGPWTGSFSDSSTKGYVVTDGDGLFTFTLESANLTFAENVTFSLDILFGDSSWESSDNALITLTTDSGTTNLFELPDGDALDVPNAVDYQGNPIVKGQWSSISFNIPDDQTFATLEIQFDSNSAQEVLIFDNIQFNGDSLIPEPSSALLLLGSAAFLFGRRRK